MSEVTTRGVTWNKKVGRWQAAIHHQNRHIHLGTFDRQEEALVAFDKAAVICRGVNALLNHDISNYLDATGQVIVDPEIQSRLLQALSTAPRKRARHEAHANAPLAMLQSNYGSGKQQQPLLMQRQPSQVMGSDDAAASSQQLSPQACMSDRQVRSKAAGGMPRLTLPNQQPTPNGAAEAAYYTGPVLQQTFMVHTAEACAPAGLPLMLVPASNDNHFHKDQNNMQANNFQQQAQQAQPNDQGMSGSGFHSDQTERHAKEPQTGPLPTRVSTSAARLMGAGEQEAARDSPKASAVSSSHEAADILRIMSKDNNMKAAADGRGAANETPQKCRHDEQCHAQNGRGEDHNNVNSAKSASPKGRSGSGRNDGDMDGTSPSPGHGWDTRAPTAGEAMDVAACVGQRSAPNQVALRDSQQHGICDDRNDMNRGPHNMSQKPITRQSSTTGQQMVLLQQQAPACQHQAHRYTPAPQQQQQHVLPCLPPGCSLLKIINIGSSSSLGVIFSTPSGSFGAGFGHDGALLAVRRFPSEAAAMEYCEGLCELGAHLTPMQAGKVQVSNTNQAPAVSRLVAGGQLTGPAAGQGHPGSSSSMPVGPSNMQMSMPQYTMDGFVTYGTAVAPVSYQPVMVQHAPGQAMHLAHYAQPPQPSSVVYQRSPLSAQGLQQGAWDEQHQHTQLHTQQPSAAHGAGPDMLVQRGSAESAAGGVAGTVHAAVAPQSVYVQGGVAIQGMAPSSHQLAQLQGHRVVLPAGHHSGMPMYVTVPAPGP